MRLLADATYALEDWAVLGGRYVAPMIAMQLHHARKAVAVSDRSRVCAASIPRCHKYPLFTTPVGVL